MRRGGKNNSPRLQLCGKIRPHGRATRKDETILFASGGVHHGHVHEAPLSLHGLGPSRLASPQTFVRSGARTTLSHMVYQRENLLRRIFAMHDVVSK